MPRPHRQFGRQTRLRMNAPLADTLRDWLVSLIATQWTQRPVPPIDQWVRDQRVLIGSKENVTYKGQVYDFDRFPAVSRLIFAFMSDPSARELFGLKHVQTAFTTAAFFAVAHALQHDPGNVIYVMDTRDKAREKLRDNLKPIFLQIVGLNRAEETADTESTSTALRFGSDAVLYIGGGHSTAALNSTAASIVVLDEAERHKIVSGTTTVSLARDRLTGAGDSGKLLVFSKPEQEARFEDGKYILEEGTVLHAEYLTGDQRKFLCACPHCSARQELVWQQLKFHHCNEALIGRPIWNKARIAEETYYECAHCEAKIHEGQEKHAFIKSGQWTPTTTGHPGRWSAHVNALTDIAFPSLSWPNLALRWVDAQGDSGKLRAFWNAILGLPEPRQRTVDTTLQHVTRLIPPPGSNDPPRWRIRDGEGRPLYRVPVLTGQLDFFGMACDVQQGHIKFVVRAFLKDGRSMLVDYGRLPDLSDIARYMEDTLIEAVDGNAYRIYQCYVDCGYRTYDVYDLCLAHPAINGIRGEGVEARYKGDGQAWVVACNTKTQQGLYVIYTAANHWERELYVSRIQHHDPLRHRPGHPAIYLPEDIGDDYLGELTGMHEVWDKDRRRPRWQKINSHTVVDYGDCEKYLLVMEWNLGARKNPAAAAA